MCNAAKSDYKKSGKGKTYICAAVEAKESRRHRVFVLSAFPEFLLDYFGMKLWKTSVRHTKTQMIKVGCKRTLF